MDVVVRVNDAVNGFVWGVPAMVCIIGVGLWLSFKTGFIQIRRFGYAMKKILGSVFSKEKAADGAVTPFQAVCTALAGTVGTGNIAGVAGAIALGGPGACILDVVQRITRNVYKVFRGYTCSPFP